jgi:hypothetical protein
MLIPPPSFQNEITFNSSEEGSLNDLRILAKLQSDNNNSGGELDENAINAF